MRPIRQRGLLWLCLGLCRVPYIDDDQWLDFTETSQAIQRKSSALTIARVGSGKVFIHGTGYAIAQLELLSDDAMAVPGTISTVEGSTCIAHTVDGQIRWTVKPL